MQSMEGELGAYAGLRGDGGLESIARAAMGAFYGAPSLVHSPSPAADRVDVSRFDPGKAARYAYPGEVKVLYAGRLTREKGADLLAESFLRAHRSDPRLHLLLARERSWGRALDQLAAGYRRVLGTAPAAAGQAPARAA